MKIRYCKSVIVLIVTSSVFLSCNKDKTIVPPATTTTVTGGLYYHNISFNDSLEFFSAKTGGTVLDSNQAKKVASTIDLSYTYDAVYGAAGFMDPVTRANKTYAGSLYTYWSAASQVVQWYGTTYTDINDSIFNAAVLDETKIGTYFSDTNNVFLAPAANTAPRGTCVGGKGSKTNFNQYAIVAFKRQSDGKRGLIRLLNTINPPTSTATNVDIVIEQ